MPFDSERFQSPAELEDVLSGRLRYDRGSRGPGVKKVQQALQDLGYGCGWLGADGVFGDGTYRAVYHFKKDRDILHAGGGIDGIVGPKTMQALDDEFSGKKGGGGGNGGGGDDPLPATFTRWSYLIETWEAEGNGPHRLGKITLTPFGMPGQAEQYAMNVDRRTGDLGSLLTGWQQGDFTLRRGMPARSGKVSAAWQQGFKVSGWKVMGLRALVAFHLTLTTLSKEVVSLSLVMADRTEEQMFRSGTYEMTGTMLRE